MQPNQISTALYLREHPILKEPNKAKREKYINFLSYYTRAGESRFADSLFSLYKKVIAGDDSYRPTPTPTIAGLFKYRYFLCIDIWFINAFGDGEKAAALLEELLEKSRLHRIFKKRLRQLYDRIYTNSGDVRFPKLQLLLDQWRENKEFFQQPVQKIVFTANMSAGKSTLVNALAGKKVNRAQSLACTAKLHYVLNKPFEDGFSAEDDNILDLDADYEVLMNDDEQNTSTNIVVSTYFRLMSGAAAPLCLLDTPGVNSSMDPAHKSITDQAIGKGDYDKLVYVINADGNIASDDEKAYMTQLAETVKDRQVIFAVNKLDAFRVGEDDIAESLGKIREDVEKIGFKNPMVCPVSAYTGYLIKRDAFDGDLDEDERDELAAKCRLFKKASHSLSKYYPAGVTQRCKALIAAEGDTERQKMLQSLFDCGLLPLEYILLNRNEG